MDRRSDYYFSDVWAGDLFGEKFADFLHRAMLETGCEQPVYAWHIADFDLPGKEFTTGSRLVRL